MMMMMMMMMIIGPGRVLVFPWLDRWVTADISASAFSVPPQQLITNDGGIIEIGKEDTEIAEENYGLKLCYVLRIETE